MAVEVETGKKLKVLHTDPRGGSSCRWNSVRTSQSTTSSGCSLPLTHPNRTGWWGGKTRALLAWHAAWSRPRSCRDTFVVRQSQRSCTSSIVPPTCTIDRKTPYEVWHGELPVVHYLSMHVQVRFPHQEHALWSQET
jgi:hypothetical protein